MSEPNEPENPPRKIGFIVLGDGSAVPFKAVEIKVEPPAAPAPDGQPCRPFLPNAEVAFEMNDMTFYGRAIDGRVYPVIRYRKGEGWFRPRADRN